MEQNSELFLHFHTHQKCQFVQRLIYTITFHLQMLLCSPYTKKQQQHNCKLECISTFAPSKSFMLFYIYLHVSVWCVNIILQAHNLCDIFDSISFGSGFAFTGRTVSTKVTPSLFTAFLNRVFYSAFVLDDDNTFASVSVQTVWKRLVTCHHLKREI